MSERKRKKERKRKREREREKEKEKEKKRKREKRLKKGGAEERTTNGSFKLKVLIKTFGYLYLNG